jgi:hypothetical protein
LASALVWQHVSAIHDSVLLLLLKDGVKSDVCRMALEQWFHDVWCARVVVEMVAVEQCMDCCHEQSLGETVLERMHGNHEFCDWHDWQPDIELTPRLRPALLRVAAAAVGYTVMRAMGVKMTRLTNSRGERR